MISTKEDTRTLIIPQSKQNLNTDLRHIQKINLDVTQPN